MREKLIQYIDLLFAGNPDIEEVKQEILQNTLDRYDDLISQGKSPESAYTLSIAGIGDIQEILGHSDESKQTHQQVETQNQTSPKPKSNRAIVIAAAIVFFILCPLPVILLNNTVGISLMFIMIAAGVALLIMNRSFDSFEARKPRSALHRVLLGIAVGGGITLYLVVSLLTKAWLITWLIFPIIMCTCGLINACFDLNKVFLSAVVRIVIFVILIAVLFVSLLGGCLGFGVSELISEYFEEQPVISEGFTESTGSVSAAQVKDIEIQWVSGSITLQPGDVDNIEFAEDSGLADKHKMVWAHNADRLVIQYMKPSVHIGVVKNVPAKHLVITVPRDWMGDQLEITSVSARIDIAQISTKSADIENVSGVCKLNQCNIAALDVETVSGEVDISGESENVTLTSVSAECSAVFSNKPGRIDLETVSGDLELILPQDCGFTLYFDGVSGKLLSDFPATVQDKRYSFGDGLCRIDAETVSGNIHLKQPQ